LESAIGEISENVLLLRDTDADIWTLFEREGRQLQKKYFNEKIVTCKCGPITLKKPKAI
jgi:hypothetical protein